MAEQVSREKESKDNEEGKEVKKDEFGNDLKEAEDLDGESKKVETIPYCPVCLQPCTYPVKLLCGHIFCFLCIKGVAFRSRRCAMCRQDIDLKYFHNPQVVYFKPKPASKEGQEETSEDTDRYQWYYEGRNGWWQYEESSSAELEKAHKEGKTSCELHIAGFLYFIDFENMVQFRKTEPGRRRRIKRDVVDAEKKGVAGLRLGNARHQRPTVTQSVSAATSSDRPASSDANNTVIPASSDANNTVIPASSDENNTVNVTSIQRLVIGSSSDNEDDGSSDQVQHTNNHS